MSKEFCNRWFPLSGEALSRVYLHLSVLFILHPLQQIRPTMKIKTEFLLNECIITLVSHSRVVKFVEQHHLI